MERVTPTGPYLGEDHDSIQRARAIAEGTRDMKTKKTVADINRLGKILDLRFIDRQGRKILQACYSARVEHGEVLCEWEDVRMEDDE